MKPSVHISAPDKRRPNPRFPFPCTPKIHLNPLYPDSASSQHQTKFNKNHSSIRHSAPFSASVNVYQSPKANNTTNQKSHQIISTPKVAATHQSTQSNSSQPERKICEKKRQPHKVISDKWPKPSQTPLRETHSQTKHLEDSLNYPIENGSATCALNHSSDITTITQLESQQQYSRWIRQLFSPLTLGVGIKSGSRYNSKYLPALFSNNTNCFYPPHQE